MESFPSFLCTICTSPYASETKEIHSTLCGHVFHIDCLQKWIERSETCPECRSEVTENNTIKLHLNTTTTPSDDFCARVSEQIAEAENKVAWQDVVIQDLQRKLREADVHSIDTENLQRTVLNFVDNLMTRKWNNFVKKQTAFWERRISESNVKGLHHLDYEMYDLIGCHLLYMTILPGKKMFHCDLCNCVLRGMDGLSSHVFGKNHKKKHARKLTLGKTFDDQFENETSKHQLALMKMIQRQKDFKNANPGNETCEFSVEFGSIKNLLTDIYASVTDLYISQSNHLTYTDYTNMSYALSAILIAFENFEKEPKKVVDYIRVLIANCSLPVKPADTECSGDNDDEESETLSEIKSLFTFLVYRFHEKLTCGFHKKVEMDYASQWKRFNNTNGSRSRNGGVSANNESTLSDSLDSLNTLANKALDRIPAKPTQMKSGKKNYKKTFFSRVAMTSNANPRH